MTKLQLLCSKSLLISVIYSSVYPANPKFLILPLPFISGHEFEQNMGDSEGQGNLVNCSPWGRRVRHDLLIALAVW